jgi:hypothetical protein
MRPVRNVMGIVARTVLGLVSLGAAATVVGRSVLERRIAGEIDALLADAQPAPSATVSEADLDPLPEPVRRWLRHTQIVGTQRPTTVRLRQEADFQLEGRGWVPYQAEQYFTTTPPAFLWKASFQLAPLVSIVGRDQYRHGQASLQMHVLSLVPVANKTGGGLNQGDLLRCLGELQWFPAGALADHLTWEPLEADSARATMRYGGVAASMTFHFGVGGRLVEARAVRYNDARSRNEAWVNRNHADAEFGGLRVPVVGEARWEYDTGPAPYIRWRITDLERNQPARYRAARPRRRATNHSMAATSPTARQGWALARRTPRSPARSRPATAAVSGGVDAGVQSRDRSRPR